MKKLILPIVIALLAGLGGGSGYAFMRTAPVVADSAASDSTHGAKPDTLAASHPAPASGVAPDSAATDTASHAARGETLPLTPADSLRALERARAELRATPGAPSVPTPMAKPAAAPVSPATPSTGATQATQQAAPPPSPVVAPPALPEQRLAKIFGAMQAKDAARVLEQMTDHDVRTILGMMSDRQAAAILAGFPATRAATITKGATRAPETAP